MTFAAAQAEHDRREPEDHALDLCGNCGGKKFEDHPTLEFRGAEYRLCDNGIEALHELLREPDNTFVTMERP